MYMFLEPKEHMNFSFFLSYLKKNNGIALLLGFSLSFYRNLNFYFLLYLEKREKKPPHFLIIKGSFRILDEYMFSTMTYTC